MSPAFAVAACAGLACAMGACLWLFVSEKQELQRLDRRWAKRHEGTEAALAAAAAQLDELRQRLREAEACAGLLVPPTPPLSGLNLSKRSQAIRMARRGEGPSQIAAALQLPQREVELLLKVHRIVLSLPSA